MAEHAPTLLLALRRLWEEATQLHASFSLAALLLNAEAWSDTKKETILLSLEAMTVFKSDPAFEDLKERLAKDEGLAKKVHSSYKINLKADDGAVKSWIIDTKSKPAYVGHDERPYEVEVNVKDSDFLKIVTGKMLPDLAYRLAKIKIKGVVGKATRLKSLFKESNLKSKL